MGKLLGNQKQKAILFLLVCASHGVLCWLLLATNRMMKVHLPQALFELLVLPAAPKALSARRAARKPTNLHLTYPPKRSPEANPVHGAQSRVESREITSPIDWNAELERVARAASATDTKPAPRTFNFPSQPPTMKDYPQFDWDYAATHRVETLPEGGMVIHLNDNCVIVLTPLPFPLCSPFKRKASGELFKHMRDPNKPDAAGVP
jgi:hypothetical protein